MKRRLVFLIFCVFAITSVFAQGQRTAKEWIAYGDSITDVLYDDDVGTAFHTREINRGIAAYTEAIKLEPNNADAFFHRGVIYAMVSDNKRAFADIERALQINPNFSCSVRTCGGSWAAQNLIKQLK